MTPEKFIDLVQLQNMLKEGIENAVPEYFWVRAEIASLAVKGNGHCWMELCSCENGKVVAQIRAVAWAQIYRQIEMYFNSVTGTSLQQGQTVLFRAYVQYSAVYGLSLVIVDVNPEFSLGDAEARRRTTAERLEKEGLMDRQKSLVLPALPYSLAVVSAQEAAGYRDFIRHLHENPEGYCFHTELFQAPMQGASCAEGIAGAIAEASGRQGCFDAVLILRGGGGKLDLSCYDEYEMCRAIAECPVPVLTAVGHDQDVHLCDAVAFGSVKTPTALADYFLDFCRDADAILDGLERRLASARGVRLALMEGRLDALEARIDAADPAKARERGLVLVLDSSGHAVKSVEALKKGVPLTLMLRDGNVRVKVDEIEKKK